MLKMNGSFATEICSCQTIPKVARPRMFRNDSTSRIVEKLEGAIGASYIQNPLIVGDSEVNLATGTRMYGIQRTSS